MTPPLFYHRREDRIRAHVTLCWLSLLLIRIAETKTHRSWAAVRDDLQDLQAVTCAGPAGVFTQTTSVHPATRDTLTALSVAAPKKILRLQAATGAEDTTD